MVGMMECSGRDSSEGTDDVGVHRKLWVHRHMHCYY
jgi:hypothetical protein